MSDYYCARCKERTGMYGHYTKHCDIVRKMVDRQHYCCPGNCELEVKVAVNYPLNILGVGLHKGIINGTTGKRSESTLAELEADLAEARSMGAGDDAKIVASGSGSVHHISVMWKGEPHEL